jgi:small-conductance mechanosensitive channel
MMGVLLGLSWYWRLVQAVQLRFESVPARYAATAGAALAFAVVVFGIYRLGNRLKGSRYSPDAVEAIQSFLVTVSAVLISGFLVAVWRISVEVIRALSFLSITPEQGIKALVTFIVFAGGVTVTRLTKRSVKYGTGRFAITPHQRELAHHAIQITVFVSVAAFVVALWGIPVSNLFLGAGVLGIVLGFAARKTLSGILSGFVILFSRPFEVGDWISVGDWEGIVTDITVYNTQIRTFNEEHVLVPNDTVTENEVINYSKTDRLRLETTVGVDYTSDIGTAAAVAVDAMERVEAVAARPPPDVIRQGFDDSAVVLRLRYWIATPTVKEKWRAQNAVIESVKAAFEAESIKIPFPQRELTGRRETGGLHVTTDSDDAERTETHGRAVRRRPDADTGVSEPVETDFVGRSVDDFEADESELDDPNGDGPEAREAREDSGTESTADGESDR